MELAESFSRASQTEVWNRYHSDDRFRGHIPTNPLIYVGLIVELDLCPDQCYLGTRRGHSESLRQQFKPERSRLAGHCLNSPLN